MLVRFYLKAGLKKQNEVFNYIHDILKILKKMYTRENKKLLVKKHVLNNNNIIMNLLNYYHSKIFFSITILNG